MSDKTVDRLFAVILFVLFTGAMWLFGVFAVRPLTHWAEPYFEAYPEVTIASVAVVIFVVWPALYWYFKRTGQLQ